MANENNELDISMGLLQLKNLLEETTEKLITQRNIARIIIDKIVVFEEYTCVCVYELLLTSRTPLIFPLHPEKS